jgi:hypothetical protein
MRKNNKKEIQITPDIRRKILQAQKNEVTEYHIYKRLARKAQNKKQKNLLNSIAEDELRHYKIWMKYSGTEVEPNRWNLIKYYWIIRVFGIEYGLKKMEDGERSAKVNYAEIGKVIPEALKLSREETLHEQEIFEMLNSKRLK